MTDTLPDGPVWSTWRKIAFRFAFIYLLLYTTPWSLVAGALPWIHLDVITQYYDQGWDWVVRFANAHWFQVAPELVPFNGSGDTSFGYAQLWLTLIIGVVGTGIWTVLDHKRKNYMVADYWTRLSVRYYIAFQCFSYGIIKLFAMQMIFPSLSQLSTPLGDLLPMRFSWLFIGYSTPYQVFAGIMETLAGLLLLNRKTVTLGLITATCVFIHVFVLNMAYDIPVKLFSLHLLLFCIYLLSYELERLTNFFIFNRASGPDTSFNVEVRKKWMRNARIISKIAFFIIAFIIPVFDSYDYRKSFDARTETKPIKMGVYSVDLYVKNSKDTIPALVGDSTRWKEVIFDARGLGSVISSDTGFWHRYGRAYFNYKPDSLRNILEWRKDPDDSLPILTMKYKLINDNNMELWTRYKDDSVYMYLTRTNRHFQLTERQFHWLSESNR